MKGSHIRITLPACPVATGCRLLTSPRLDGIGSVQLAEPGKPGRKKARASQDVTRASVFSMCWHPSPSACSPSQRDGRRVRQPRRPAADRRSGRARPETSPRRSSARERARQVAGAAAVPSGDRSVRCPRNRAARSTLDFDMRRAAASPTLPVPDVASMVRRWPSCAFRCLNPLSRLVRHLRPPSRVRTTCRCPKARRRSSGRLHRSRGKCVSMPCWLLFEKQGGAYRDQILGTAPCMAVEAQVRMG